MKKKKKIALLSSILTFIVTLSVVLPIVLIKIKNKDDTPPTTPPSDPPPEVLYERSADGKYIYFGYYPQSIKANDVVVNPEPNADGYYEGNDGELYVKKRVEVDLISLGMTEEEVYNMGFMKDSTGSNLIIGLDYYFKLEKLKWRILKEENGSAFLVCDSIIDSTQYQANYIKEEYTYYATDEQGNTLLAEDGETKIYANNYKHSTLRSFLNKDFYKMAFTTKQKEIINLTEVDNSDDSTLGYGNIYACENTNDYIFALSYADIKNEEYGFYSSHSVYDVEKMWKASDYSKSNFVMTLTENWVVEGLGISKASSIYTIQYEPYIETSSPWLRSPRSASSSSAYATGVVYSTDRDSVFSTIYGVVPALYLNVNAA